MKIQVRTLSPIHIGDGEKYNGLGYIGNKGTISFYDSTKIVENIGPQHLEKFTQWIEQCADEIKKLEKQKRTERDEQKKRTINQLLRNAQKRLSLKEFLETSLRDVSIKKRFAQNSLYTIESQSQIYNNIDIDCFIKQNTKVYIPGSEIKGAIRTALAYSLLQKDGHWEWLKNELKKFGVQHRHDLDQIAGNKGKLANEIKKRLVNEIGTLEEKLQNKLFRADKNNDAKYDFLKLLHIGDTDLRDPNVCLFVSNLEVKGINRGSFPLFQELCKTEQVFICDFGLESTEKNKAMLPDKLGFNDEQKWVVADIKNLFQCCYEFSKRLLQEEVKFFTKINQSIVTKLKAIEQQNKPGSPVIRIGKNEGYLSLTMGLLVKDKDEDLYNNVLCHSTKNTSYTGNFPKTRRVVNLLNNEQDTLGWVALGELTEEMEAKIKEADVALQDMRTAPALHEHVNRDETMPAPKEPVAQPAPEKKEAINEVWEKAVLAFTPGNQTLTAKFADKKTAFSQNKDLVSEGLKKKLFEQRKEVTARVTVERYGNAFRIVKIEMEKGLGV